MNSYKLSRFNKGICPFVKSIKGMTLVIEVTHKLIEEWQLVQLQLYVDLEPVMIIM